jgi:hypothetical protein
MNRSNTMTSGCLCAAILATAANAADPAERKEGNWEVKLVMEMVGIPMAIPPVTVNQCVTKQDVVPDLSQLSQQCAVKEQKIVGNTVSWKMQCSGKDGKMEGEGLIKFANETYDGTMSMTMTQAGGPAMNMKYTMQGKWTGPCKADSTKAKTADSN